MLYCFYEKRTEEESISVCAGQRGTPPAENVPGQRRREVHFGAAVLNGPADPVGADGRARYRPHKPHGPVPRGNMGGTTER